MALERGSGESPLPESILGTIMSFTVHGSDPAELDRVKMASPKIRKAVDQHPSVFNRGRILEIRDHPDPSLNGVWYFVGMRSSSKRIPANLFSEVKGFTKAKSNTTEYRFEKEGVSIFLTARGHPLVSPPDLSVLKTQYLLALSKCGGSCTSLAQLSSTAVGSTVPLENNAIVTVRHCIDQWHTLRAPFRLVYTNDEKKRSQTLLRQMSNLQVVRNFNLNPPGGLEELLEQMTVAVEHADMPLLQQTHEEMETLTKRIQLRARRAQASFRLRVLWADAPSGAEL